MRRVQTIVLTAVVLLVVPSLAVAQEPEIIAVSISSPTVLTEGERIRINASLGPIGLVPGAQIADRWLNALIPLFGNEGRRTTIIFDVELYRRGERWLFGLLQGADQRIGAWEFSHWAESLLRTGRRGFAVHQSETGDTQDVEDINQVHALMMNLADAPLPYGLQRTGDYYLRVRARRGTMLLGGSFETAWRQTEPVEVRVVAPANLVAEAALEEDGSPVGQLGRIRVRVRNTGGEAPGLRVVVHWPSALGRPQYRIRPALSYNAEVVESIAIDGLELRISPYLPGRIGLDLELVPEEAGEHEIRYAFEVSSFGYPGDFRLEPHGVAGRLSWHVRDETVFPELRLGNDTVQFESTSMGATSRDSLTVINDGQADLTVTVDSLTGRGITADLTSVTITPGERERIWLAWTPAQPGSAAGSIVLRTNDPQRPTLVARWEGSAPAGNRSSEPTPPTDLDPTGTYYSRSSDYLKRWPPGQELREHFSFQYPDAYQIQEHTFLRGYPTIVLVDVYRLPLGIDSIAVEALENPTEPAIDWYQGRLHARRFTAVGSCRSLRVAARSATRCLYTGFSRNRDGSPDQTIFQDVVLIPGRNLTAISVTYADELNDVRRVFESVLSSFEFTS